MEEGRKDERGNRKEEETFKRVKVKKVYIFSNSKSEKFYLAGRVYTTLEELIFFITVFVFRQ